MVVPSDGANPPEWALLGFAGIFSAQLLAVILKPRRALTFLYIIRKIVTCHKYNSMKKIISIVIVLECVLSFFCSCNETVVPEGLPISLDSLLFYDSLARHRYDVSDQDVHEFLEHRYCTKSDAQVKVEAIVKDNSTLAYLITYDKGWELLSADKRMVPVIAFSQNGSFPIDNKDILQFFSADLEIIDLLKTGKLAIPANDSIAIQNYTKWARITQDATDRLPQTKMEGDPFEDERYWELVDSDWIYDIAEDPGHLIQTRWHQLSPWNKYAPARGPYDGLKDPAGCSAIAVSQMLFYLHNKIGLPLSSPGGGYCTGYSQELTDTTYHQEYYNFSSTTWDDMAISMGDTSHSDTLSALLIGYVGKSLSTQYSPAVSQASIDNAIPFFVSLGISSSSPVSLDGNTVYSSVKNAEMPVILSVYTTKETNFWGQVTYRGGHSFLADAYVDVYHVYDNTYMWMSQTQNNLYQYGQIKSVRDTTCDRYLKMIWGYGNPVQDNVEYAVNASHFQTYIDGTSYDFKYYRRMIYGFEPL